MVIIVYVKFQRVYGRSCVVNVDREGCDCDDGWRGKSVTLAGYLGPLYI